MIKPVYFGKHDKHEITFANNQSNFSDWVKSKIREEIGIENLYHSKIVGIDNKNLEEIIRNIITKMNINIDSGKDIQGDKEVVEIDVGTNDISEIKEVDGINLDMWSL